VTASPAARLLAAADLLDKRANDATEGPWAVEKTEGWYSYGGPDVNHEEAWEIVSPKLDWLGDPVKAVKVDLDRDYAMPNGGIPREADALYIALVNPEVGKALADLLRAEVSEMYDPSAQAVALADALLAGDPR
jgi:hypothetical protein